MRPLLLLLSLWFALMAEASNACCVLLKENAPQRYVVQANDTLWSISSRFLKSPWEWKKLWHANRSVKNPNRLMVGAIIELHYQGKKPYLKVVSNGIIKWSPTMKLGANPDPVPPIPLNDLEPFLNKSFVLDQDVLNEAPYIVAFTDEHLMGGQGDTVYVNHLPTPKILPAGTSITYSIFRPTKVYYNPKTDEVLGYLAKFIGNGDLVTTTRPPLILLTDITEGVKIKDRVVIDDQPDFDPNFEPETPATIVQGEEKTFVAHGLVATSKMWMGRIERTTRAKLV